MFNRIIARIRLLLEAIHTPLRIEVEGSENIPADGAIIACNFVHTFDPLRVSSALGRKTISLNKISPARQPNESKRRSIVEKALSRGQLVLIFPERYPSIDGKLHRGYPEVAGLALRLGVDLVPCGLSRIPENSSAPWVLKIAKPLDLSRYQEMTGASDQVDNYWLRGITDELMTRIAELSGQEYQDTYYEQARDMKRHQVDLAARKAEKQWAKAQAAREQELQRQAEEAEEEEAQLVAAAKAAREYVERLAEAEEAAARQQSK